MRTGEPSGLTTAPPGAGGPAGAGAASTRTSRAHHSARLLRSSVTAPACLPFPLPFPLSFALALLPPSGSARMAQAL